MDVVLEPLMEVLKILWETGVQMLDKYHKDPFTLRATIFALSSQFKEKVGCAICIDGTAYVSLSASKKIVYMRHIHSLLKGHRYRVRKMDKYFDNNNKQHYTAPSCNNRGQSVF